MPRRRSGRVRGSSGAHLPEQGAVIGQDRPRGVVAGGAGDAAAGVGTGAAVVEPFQRPAIIGMA